MEYEILFFKEIEGTDYAVLLNDMGSIALEECDRDLFSVGEVFLDAEPQTLAAFSEEIQNEIFSYLGLGA